MPTRKDIASQWLIEHGLASAQATQYDAMDAFKADPNNAEYAKYNAWAKSARSIGVDGLKKVSKAYRVYMDGLPADVKNDPRKLESAAYGHAAFLATEGERASLYSSLEPDTFDPSKVNPVDALTASAGNATPAPAAKKSPGQKVVDDLRQYQIDMAIFDQKFQAFTHNPNDHWDENQNPMLLQALRWHLSNAGITVPSLPSSVQNYEAWVVARQQMGMPSSIQDYDAWAKQAQAALSPYGYSLDDALNMAVASGSFNPKDPYVGTSLSRSAVATGKTAPFAGLPVGQNYPTSPPFGG
jgi:hypothetical protein